MRPELAIWLATWFLLPAALGAQDASGGPLLALPHGFSIDAATPLPATGTGAIVFANLGIDGALPPPGTPTGTPDFATWLGGAAVDVDALSLGLDWVVGTSSGVATLAPDQWAAITFSVTRPTAGLPGSLVATAAGEPDGAAADVFSYVIPGSNLPPALVGVPLRAQDSPETSTFVGGTPGNIDAHDLYVALLYLENPQLAALLPPPTVFFSVTAATAAAIPAAWSPSPALRTGATVFATTWNPATSTWSTPAVAFAPTVFGILASEDLDALALDLVHGLVLFSTSVALPPPSGPRDPILFSVLGSGIHHVYRLPGGTPISAAVGLGLGPDDVDGICALDPGSPGAPNQLRLPFQLGTPAPALVPGLPTQLQASAWRRLDPSSGAEYAQTWMTGWPVPGTPQPGFAVVAAAVGSPLGPYVLITAFARPLPGNPFAGHPERFELAIPPSYSLTGLPLYFLWGALSATALDVSHPVGILL